MNTSSTYSDAQEHYFMSEDSVPYSGAISLPKEYCVHGSDFSRWLDDPPFGAIVFLDYGDFPIVGVIEE